MMIIGGLALCVWINFRTKEPSSLFSSPPPPPPPPSIPIRLIYTCCVCVCVCMCAIFVVKVSHPELSPPRHLWELFCVYVFGSLFATIIYMVGHTKFQIQ